MKKIRIGLLILIALVLMTPSVLLIARAVSVGDFPKPEETSEIELKKPNGEVMTFSRDSNGYTLLFDLCRLSKRVDKGELPSGSDTVKYPLTFCTASRREKLTLCVSKADYDVYLVTSEKKVYHFDMPGYTIGSMRIAPSQLTWVTTGEDGDRTVLTYDSIFESGEKVVQANQLISWDILLNISATVSPSKEEYHMFDDRQTLIATVSDPAVVASTAGVERVLLESRTTIAEGVDVILTFYFQVNPGEWGN